MTMTIQVESPTKRKVYRLGKKFLGYLEGETFYRNNAILYRELNGYGMDRWLIKELEKANCQQLAFTDKSEGRTYRITFSDFIRHSKEVDHEGWNLQRCCPRNFWQVIKVMPKQLSLL